MRKNRRFASFALPVLLASSPALAQWWWPPGMSVDPANPDPSSNIIATLSGDWNDACPPNMADVIRTGPEIDIDLWRDPPPGFCLTVITPWSLQVPIGALPTGTYSVYSTYFISGSPAHSRTLLGTIEVAAACYADCDGNEMLNVDDFLCFINEFAQAIGLPPQQQIGHYANCDGNSSEPILTVDDFICFINEFAQGCP
jgi:hypothetical protein